MRRIKLKWVNIEKSLPKENVPVLVFRKKYNERTNIYLAKRNDSPLSTDEDASKNCHWSGMPITELMESSDYNDGIHFDRSFSDVTVEKWTYLF